MSDIKTSLSAQLDVASSDLVRDGFGQALQNGSLAFATIVPDPLIVNPDAVDAVFETKFRAGATRMLACVHCVGVPCLGWGGVENN